MPDPTILSGSSLNTFIECPKEWEYTYLWRLHRPPSFKMALGTAAHYAVEQAMRNYINYGGYPSLSDWLLDFETQWRYETRDTKPRNDKPEESAEAHFESGIRCVTFYAAEIAPHIVPFAVEEPISFTINGYVWTGMIDLIEAVDGDPKRLRLRDHKFTSKRPDNPTRYRWPMIGYAIGLRKKFKVVEEDVILDYVIRNKKPVHFPVALGGPASDQDIIDLAQEIEDAMTVIQRGTFPPLGRDTGACNWCPYRDFCPDSTRKKE